MFDFIDNIRDELFVEFIDVLDFLSVGSLNLYDRITENLILMIRTQLRKRKCEDNFMV